MKRPLRIAAFTKYDSLAAGTRQRFLQYRPQLQAAGFELDHYALLPNEYVRGLGTGRSYPKWRLAGRYLKRMIQLARSDADLLWIHAELFPYLPAGFERLAALSGKPIVYDCDDAYFDVYEKGRFLRGKISALISKACASCAGNPYLLEYVERFCPNSFILPTVVDTEVYTPEPTGNEIPVIGWIGSASTWNYLKPILPVLRKLAEEGSARIRIIGAGSEADEVQFEGLELVDWTEENEVGDVQSMDIGIMHIPDDSFTRGKSGYKLIQYMACALPVVASPIGVNSDIVEPGVNGFLAGTHHEWEAALRKLIADPDLRRRMGAVGRERAVASYSLAAQGPRLVKIMKDCARR